MYIFIMKLLYLLLPVVSAGLCDTNCQDTGRICTDLGTNYTCGCDKSGGFWGHTCACGSGFAGEETVNSPATCVSQSGCAEDEYVSNHACKECSMLTRNSAGDLATGEDTACVTRDWVVATASALGGSVLGVGGVLVWHYSRV